MSDFEGISHGSEGYNAPEAAPGAWLPPSWSAISTAQPLLFDFQKKARRGGLSNKRWGKFYEDYVGFRFEAGAWDVEFRGYIAGRKDGGIDLIARKAGSTIAIQCKVLAREKQVRDWMVLKLRRDAEDFEKREGIEFSSVLFVSNASPDDPASEMAALHKISFRLLGYSHSWPMVKCNVCLRTGNKRYYLPTDAGYHALKVTQARGERYVENCMEAEQAGFRWIGR